MAGICGVIDTICQKSIRTYLVQLIYLAEALKSVCVCVCVLL